MKTEKSPEINYIEKLVNEYHYPKEDILTNVSTSFGMARYVQDIVVVKEGKPYIVVEIKRNISRISLDQLSGYVRASGAKFAVASNGYIDHCYSVENIGYEITLREIPDIPRYGQELKTIGTHDNEQLIAVTSNRFEKLLWEIADVYRTQGISPEESMRDLSKVLLLKVYDEKTGSSRFRALFGEPTENVQSRINALRMEAAKQYPNILKDALFLKNESLVKVVQMLQKYCIIESANDTIGSKLPMSNLGPRSYTRPIPKNVLRLLMEMLQPDPHSQFIVPECNIGDLLVEAAKRCALVIGTESNTVLAQYAEISLALSNLKGQIFVQPKLTPASAMDNQIVSSKSFDYAAIYPPFGVRVDDSSLNNFVLGSNRKSQSLEALLLEYTLGFLKAGGKMAIVVPEGFLFTDSASEAREFLLKKAKILAIISLPAGTFLPSASIKASLLILESSSEGTPLPSQVFVAAPESPDSFDKVVSDFNSFKPTSSLSAGYIWSARNLTAHFLISETDKFMEDAALGKPSTSGEILILKKEGTEHVELRELVGLTSGARLEDIGQKDSEGNVYYLKAGNVGDFIINLDSAERFSAKKDFSRWHPAPGDILMTRAGTVGRVALVKNEARQMVVGLNVVKLTIYDKSRLLPEYLLAYLSSRQGLAQINYYTGGAVIRAISQAGIGQIKVPLAPIEKQRKIAEQINEVIETKEKEKHYLQELQARETKLREEIGNLLGE
jgi:type I restriction enzyme M protein